MLGKNLCDLNLYTRVLFRSMPFRSMDPSVYSAWNLLQTFMHESSSGCYCTITLQLNLALQSNLQKSLGLVLKSESEKSGRSLGSLHFHMAGKRVDPPGPPCIVSKLWVLTEMQYGIFCITIYTWIVDSLRLNKSQGL
jgi:hypothetical protein